MTYTIIATKIYPNGQMYYATRGKHLNPRDAKEKWDKVRSSKKATCKFHLIPDNKLDAFLAYLTEKAEKQAEIAKHNDKVKMYRYAILEEAYYHNNLRVSDAFEFTNKR